KMKNKKWKIEKTKCASDCGPFRLLENGQRNAERVYLRLAQETRVREPREKYGRLARKIGAEIFGVSNDAEDEATFESGVGRNSSSGGDGCVLWRGERAGEQAGETGSGFARGPEARLSREDGISGEAGAVHTGLSEMDSRRARAEWTDRGLDGREAFCEWKRSELAARYWGYVRVCLRSACWRGDA